MDDEIATFRVYSQADHSNGYFCGTTINNCTHLCGLHSKLLRRMKALTHEDLVLFHEKCIECGLLTGKEELLNFNRINISTS